MEPLEANLGVSGRLVLAFLGALMGTMIGIIVQLLLDDTGDTDVGAVLGLVFGAIFGVWYGQMVYRRAQQQLLEDMRAPWLDLEDVHEEVDLSRVRLRHLVMERRDGRLDAPAALRMRNRLEVEALWRRLQAEGVAQQMSMEEGEARATPAAEPYIEALPTHRVTPEELAAVPEEHKSCTICLEEFSPGEEQRTLLCFHRFHKSCVDNWLRESGMCPICKTRVDGPAWGQQGPGRA